MASFGYVKHSGMVFLTISVPMYVTHLRYVLVVVVDVNFPFILGQDVMKTFNLMLYFREDII